MQDIPLTVGQQVVVRNTSPMPPKHHHRKLAEWERWNFNGKVLVIDRDYNEIQILKLNASNRVTVVTIHLNDSSKSILPRIDN